MITDAIRQAQIMHRAAIEATYNGSCNIYNREPKRDPETGVTALEDVCKLENQLCHLSFSSSVPAAETGTVTNVTQTIKLFLAPEIVIAPGSKIEVSQHGRTEVYGQSGKAAVHSSHQEILLELWKGYA